MKMLRPDILLLAFALLALSACGPLDLSRHRATSPAPAAGEETESVRQKIRKLLEAESHLEALALVRQELRGDLTEAALAEEYGRAVNGVLKQAETYRETDLPEKSGPLYMAALEGFPATPAVAKRVSLDAAGISAWIETCADLLMEQGLAAYRSGDLDGAIRTWKRIQAFAPQHPASLKALQTAEVQRANLEKGF